jgi:hypothetical protein
MPSNDSTMRSATDRSAPSAPFAASSGLSVPARPIR